MKRNEKILAGVLGLFLVGYLMRGPIVAMTTGPIDELQSTLDGRLERSGTLSNRKATIGAASLRVNDARSQSLPADVSYAERLYPQWLQDLATISGWEEVRTELRPVQARRDEQFRPVRVELRGLATLAELDLFLRRFRRTDLLHRINSSKVASPSEVGDAPLDVLIEAEALSLPTAAQREEIFPFARLTADLSADDEAAEVTVPAGLSGAFPEEPGFTVRAGTEFLTVADVQPLGEEAGEEGAAVRWTLRRGAEGTQPADLSAGTFLQLWPHAPPAENAPAFSETGPFRKPRSYAPELKLDGSPRLVRGESFSLTASTVDYDPRGGEPTLSATGLPEGATFDPATGKLSWDPPADLPAGEYEVEIAAAVPRPDKRVTGSVLLTLVDRNTPPTVSSVEPKTVNAGDVLLFETEANDAEDGDEVDFSLVDPPEGAFIDSFFGLVRWEVPADLAPGEMTLTVRATDQGSPPLSGETRVRVTVTEDLRPYVKFVGRVTRNGEPVATLFNQAENQITRLEPGDDFALAGIEGRIVEIGRDSLEYRRNGRRYRLPLGASLADAVDRGAIDPPPASAEPAADPATDPAAGPAADPAAETEGESDDAVAESGGPAPAEPSEDASPDGVGDAETVADDESD
ncbi:putative Ig domain-containing protein [Alienimonas californiensis]|uniref:Ig domain protein n=1 Tax=Alienimonas californiensis TaxID=2527989 RepID=A0A517PDZ3_9PLAN|nr:putative Ig domain-containing protein [Alienimonas californiensis]QDT17571.1 Putative Ig domain protein [Alienimonas californiensis]